jgi:hypothetical protein
VLWGTSALMFSRRSKLWFLFNIISSDEVVFYMHEHDNDVRLGLYLGWNCSSFSLVSIAILLPLWLHAYPIVNQFETPMALFCKSCFGLFQLVSAYSLSQNTIESAKISRLFHQPNQPYEASSLWEACAINCSQHLAICRRRVKSLMLANMFHI